MEGPNHNSTPHLPVFHLMLAVLALPAVIVKVVTTHYRASNGSQGCRRSYQARSSPRAASYEMRDCATSSASLLVLLWQGSNPWLLSFL